MHTRTTQLTGLRATLTAHSDGQERLLLAEITADDEREASPAETPPAKVAIVIDRSGSMSGRKLQITLESAAKLVRSLRPEDRVAVVTYDDQVQVLAELEPPGERLAARIESVRSGGSTNLYGGWLEGAKRAGAGGRVILLSDGLANHGPVRDAEGLAQHAGISYDRYRVTTTTIGIGQDYDEALMAGMARTGGGSHYFAHTAEAIMDAFSQERFSLGALAVSHVSLRYQDETRSLGHFWAGETRRAVLPIRDLSGPPATLRYTPASDGRTRTEPVDLPAEFGRSDEATLWLLIERAAEIEEGAVAVRSPQTARDAREAVRSIVLRLLAHPLADTEVARAAVERLKAAIDRLERLEREYDEHEAVMHRKRSMQSGYNLRSPAKAYSAFADEAHDVQMMAFCAMAESRVELRGDPRALALAPIEKWREWRALPIRLDGNQLEVVCLNPRDGFLLRHLERELRVRVRPLFQRVTERELLEALDSLETHAPGR